MGNDMIFVLLILTFRIESGVVTVEAIKAPYTFPSLAACEAMIEKIETLSPNEKNDYVCIKPRYLK
jgi:hypothetical protein